jgi:hypothetical protein
MKAKIKQLKDNDKMISMPVVNPHAAGIDIVVAVTLFVYHKTM